MPRNLNVALPLPFIHFHDVALDDVYNIAFADSMFLKLSMISFAEGGLDFLRL